MWGRKPRAGRFSAQLTGGLPVGFPSKHSMESHEPPLMEPPVPWATPRPRLPPQTSLCPHPLTKPRPPPGTPPQTLTPTPSLPARAQPPDQRPLSGPADEEVLEECTPTHDRVCQCRSGYFYAHEGSSESCSPCSTWVTLLGGPARPVCTAQPRLCSPAHSGQVFPPLCSPPRGESLPSGILPVVETIFSASFCLCRFLCLPFPDSWPPCLLAPHFLQTLSTALCHDLP